MQIYTFIEPKFRPDKHHLCTGSQNNESSRRNLAEKLVYFAGCRLLSTTLVMNNIKCCILRVRIKLSLLHLHWSISTPPPPCKTLSAFLTVHLDPGWREALCLAQEHKTMTQLHLKPKPFHPESTRLTIQLPLHHHKLLCAFMNLPASRLTFSTSF